MKKKYIDAVKVTLILLVVIVAMCMMDSLPWWSFVIPVLIVGIVVTARKWGAAGFMAGFIPGFIAWSGAGFWFNAIYNGIVLNRIGGLLGVPRIVILIIPGVIGGALAGLALYVGKCVVEDFWFLGKVGGGK